MVKSNYGTPTVRAHGMTRAEALCIHNAQQALQRAIFYLLVQGNAGQVGSDSWQRNAATLRDALRELTDGHSELFDECASVLRRYDEREGRTQ